MIRMSPEVVSVCTFANGYMCVKTTCSSAIKKGWCALRVARLITLRLSITLLATQLPCPIQYFNIQPPDSQRAQLSRKQGGLGQLASVLKSHNYTRTGGQWKEMTRREKGRGGGGGGINEVNFRGQTLSGGSQ
jgi:hypothetical protein